MYIQVYIIGQGPRMKNKGFCLCEFRSSHLILYFPYPLIFLQISQFYFSHKWIYSIVCVYHIFIINLSVDGHLGCFHFLFLMNIAAINIDVFLCGRIRSALGFVPAVMYLGYIVYTVLTFWGTPVLIFRMTVLICTLTSSKLGLLLVHILSNIVVRFLSSRYS